MRTMVLFETQHTAGLTLFQVLRGGLWLDSCLGMTMCRANVSIETAPHTCVQELQERSKHNVTHARDLEFLAYVPCTLSFVGS